MKKFGLKKSGDGGDDDASRRALFGSLSKDKSPAPQGNPYSQQSNPYAQPMKADPYTRAKMNAGITPGGSGGYDQKGPSPSNGPTGSGGYAPNRYGNQGYGAADRYGSGGGANAGAGPGAGGSRYGPGGYGGLGATDPNDPDTNRDALFGGARERLQERQQTGPPPPYSNGGGYGQSGVHGEGGAYGDGNPTTSTYQERNLTAEEQEDEDVQAVKQEIRAVKQGDVASSRNALRAAAEAEETGRNTLARLGAQGERFLDTERALNIASSQNRIAEEKSRELNTLNKSMFAVHVSNPFTSSARQRQRDEQIMNTHREERATRDGTRAEAFQTSARMERTFREIDRQANKPAPKVQKNMADRAKYQFEADSEDEAMEDEIDSNLNLLQGAATRLNGLAKATNDELTEHNRILERVTGKSDYVDDQIAMNRARLDRIR